MGSDSAKESLYFYVQYSNIKTRSQQKKFAEEEKMLAFWEKCLYNNHACEESKFLNAVVERPLRRFYFLSLYFSICLLEDLMHSVFNISMGAYLYILRGHSI